MQRIMQGSAYIQSDEHEVESETPSRPIDTNMSNNQSPMILSNRKLVYHKQRDTNTFNGIETSRANIIRMHGCDEESMTHIEKDSYIDVINYLPSTPVVQVAFTPRVFKANQVSMPNGPADNMRHFSDLTPKNKLQVIMETRVKLQNTFKNSINNNIANRFMTKRQYRGDTDSSSHFSVQNISQIYQKSKIKQQAIDSRSRMKSVQNQNQENGKPTKEKISVMHRNQKLKSPTTQLKSSTITGDDDEAARKARSFPFCHSYGSPSA